MILRVHINTLSTWDLKKIWKPLKKLREGITNFTPRNQKKKNQMDFKNTVRMSKVALKQPWLYNEQELRYMRKAKKLAQKALKFKHMKGEENEG